MVQIKPKRPHQPVPFLQKFITSVLEAKTDDEIQKALSQFEPPHHFERPEERNLLSWYKVLNRFDHLLGCYISERDIFSKLTDEQSRGSKSEPMPESEIAPSNVVPDSTMIRPSRQSSARTSQRHTMLQSSSGQREISRQMSSHENANEEAENTTNVVSPSPVTVQLILRTTHRLLRNASHDTKHLYCSLEHIAALLGDAHSAIVWLSLEILNALLHRSQKYRPSRVVISSDISERLLQLSTGWGGRESGLGLLECCSSKHSDSLPREGSKLVFEYDIKPASNESTPAGNGAQALPDSNVVQRRSSKKSSNGGNSKRGNCPIPLSNELELKSEADPNIIARHSGQAGSIVIEDVSKCVQSERKLLLEVMSLHQVPKQDCFPLLCAYRRAKQFSHGRAARLNSAILRLQAISALFQIQPLPPVSQELLRREPELVHDVVAIARAGSEDGLEDVPLCLQTVAIRCLTAISLDRNRINSVVNATGAGVHHGALPTLFRTEVNHLLSPGTDTGTSEGHHGRMNIDSVPEYSTEENEQSLSLLSEINRVSQDVQKLGKIELLLSLVHVMALYGSSFGTNPIAQAGLLPVLVPFLSKRDGAQARLLSHAIATIYAIIQNSSPSLGSQVFRDNDGLSLLAKRISQELGVDDSHMVPSTRLEEDEAVEVEALRRRGESRDLYEKLGKSQMTPAEALQNLPPSSNVASRGLLPHSTWVLLRALLQLLIGAMGTGGSEVRELVLRSQLPRALRKVIAQPFLHGGSLFQSAATVTTNIAHAEPTATSELVKAGIGTALLRSIEVGLPPCAEAVRCVPNLLAALCLTPSARDVIVSSQPLKQYLMRLATPFYIRALHGDTPISIGNSLDELMRHVEALRPSGNEAMLEYLKMAAAFVCDDSKAPKTSNSQISNKSSTTQNSSRLEDRSKAKDGHLKSSKSASSSESTADNVDADAVLLDRMKLGIAHNSCRLAGFAQGSLEHQKGIVNNGGLNHMIALRQATALAAPETTVRDGATSSRHFPVPHTVNLGLLSSLRNFSSRHHSAVLKSIFHVILEDAAAVLAISKQLNGAWLPEEEGHDQADEASKSLKPAQKEVAANVQLELEHHMSENENLLASLKASLDEAFRDGHRSFESFTNSKHKTSMTPTQIRKELSEAIAKLRTDIVILAGLSRGGPGSGAGAWESAGGSQVATIVSTVERAARVHLASVYTGITLTPTIEGDLTTAAVTATSDPTMRTIHPEEFRSFFTDINDLAGYNLAKSKTLEEACEKYEIPPEAKENNRKAITGLAWQLETFVVSCQNLYASLSRGLTFSSRRLSRDPSRYAASARSLAATIGRIFALHLQAARSLWDVHVVTMKRRKVVAALDYVRRILVAIRKTIFDEQRRTTQSLVLRSFINAGGAEALSQTTKPLLIVQSAVQLSASGTKESEEAKKRGVPYREVDRMLEGNTLATMSFILACNNAVRQYKNENGKDGSKSVVHSKNEIDQYNNTMSTFDSISDQAKAISQIAVTNNISQENKTLGKESRILHPMFLNNTLLEEMESQVHCLSKIGLDRCCDFAVQGVASEAWSTFCSFTSLLTSCPGLLGSSTNQESMDAGGWEPKAFQRSTVTIAMKLLNTVTDHPETLLTAFRLDGSAMTDILGIIHTISRLEKEIGEQDDDLQSAIAPLENTNRRTNPTEDDSQPNVSQIPSTELINQLVEMGFPRERAVVALRNIAPTLRDSLSRGLEHAANWLLNNTDSGEDVGGSEIDRDGSWEADGENNESHEAEREDQSRGEVPVEGTEDNGNGPSVAESIRNSAVESSEQVSNENGSDEIMADSTNSPQVMPLLPESDVLGTVVIEQASPETHTAPDGNHTPECEHTTATSKRDDQDSSAQISCMENDDSRPLLQSVQIELELLSKALKEVKLIDVTEVPAIRSVAETYIGTVAKEREEQVQQNVFVIPVTVPTFKAQKRKLFSSLKQLALAIIKHTEKSKNDPQLAFIAVELISILHKGASSDQYEEIGLSKLVSDGLHAALQSYGKQIENGGSSPRSQVATVWAHYGGFQARQALDKCHAYELASKSLTSNVSWWQSHLNVPHVDKEATCPIQTLSISESHESLHENHDTNSPQESNLRFPDREEVQVLVQTSTCLLLLDSAIRYERKDKLVIHAKRNVSNDAEKSTGPTASQKETPNVIMKVSNNDYERRNSTDMTGEDGDGDSRMNPSSEIIRDQIRDLLGPVSSSMDIDRWRNDRAVDLDGRNPNESGEITKVSAEASKTEKLVKAKDEITKSMLCADGADSDIVVGISKTKLITDCLHLLRLWKDLEVGDTMIALLQLLGSLTLDWKVAKYAWENNIIDDLLRLPHLDGDKVRSVDYRVTRSLAKTVIRHMIEDPETLTEAMATEIRRFIAAQSRTRSATTVKALISATSPLVARDINCYLTAVSQVVRINDTDGDKVTALAPKTEHTVNLEKILEQRPNIDKVVTSLSLLLKEVKTDNSEDNSQKDTNTDLGKPLSSSVAKFSLETLSELVDLSQAVALSCAKARSPAPDPEGLALDYVIKNLLPDSLSSSVKATGIFGMTFVQPDQDNVSEAARKLIQAMCSTVTSTYEATIAALARAAKVEADKKEVSPGLMKGIANCVAPGCKLRVLRAVIQSSLPNDMARSLVKMNLKPEQNADAASSILRALTLIGQASTHIARHGDNLDDDVSFGDGIRSSIYIRDPFYPIRMREDELLMHTNA